MDSIVTRLEKLLTDVTIVPGQQLRWSPKDKQISCPPLDDDPQKIWGLLHEAGHAKLNHINYSSDIELLQLEVAAWVEAENIANALGIAIDPDHIQDCLDTYRDWLHQRSTCPRCGIVTFQEAVRAYCCYNCNKRWSVTASRFCRPYRRSADKPKDRPEQKLQAVFGEKLY